MLADEFPDMGYLGPKSVGGTSVTLSVYVDDVDAQPPTTEVAQVEGDHGRDGQRSDAVELRKVSPCGHGRSVSRR